MIELHRLTKRFGALTAVDDLSFTVRPGHVTGFLGPNSAARPRRCASSWGWTPRPRALRSPGAVVTSKPSARYWQVGSLLDATAVHGGRTAYDHLLSVALSNGIGRARVTQVLELAGLSAVAAQRLRGFSLGMKQRLGIAAALLGEPPVLLFDEPVNGLDTNGVRWIRLLLRQLAADGRTVLVSSHLMSEMELTADHLIIIGRGRLLADMQADRLTKSSTRANVLVKSPRPRELATLLTARGAAVTHEDDGGLAVTGLIPAIADLAAANGIAVHELVPRQPSLEQAYLDLTAASTDYRAGAPAGESEASR